MIKIMFLIHDLGQGGAEKTLINLVNHLDTRRFEITVMSLFGGGVNEKNLIKNIKYKVCHSRAIPGNSHIMKLFSPAFLYRFYIKENYDIVVSFLEGPSARIVSGCNNPNTKLVSWIHFTYHSQKELARSFRSMNEAKRVYERFDETVFVSKGVKEAFEKLCSVKGKAEVLYNVNDTELIEEKAKESTERGLFPEGEFSWCGVGKIVPIKGFDRLLRIHKRLISSGVPSHLYIIGEGPLKSQMKQWCEEHKVEHTVSFLGYQVNPYKYISRCSLYVCSSYSEGFSTAATEALIVGTPVCTVDVSGMNELLGENKEYGIITENDEEALYQEIKELWDNPALLQYYKAQAWKRGKSFSTNNTVKAVENMFLSMGVKDNV